MEAKKVYVCEGCETPHESRYWAEECCKPGVEIAYQCSKCEDVHYTVENADDCCKAEEEHSNETTRCPLTIDMFQGDTA